MKWSWINSLVCWHRTAIFSTISTSTPIFPANICGYHQSTYTSLESSVHCTNVCICSHSPFLTIVVLWHQICLEWNDSTVESSSQRPKPSDKTIRLKGSMSIAKNTSSHRTVALAHKPPQHFVCTYSNTKTLLQSQLMCSTSVHCIHL